MIYESDAAAVPRQRSDAQGPEAGELPVREQVGGLASQGYRLRPLRVLQPWYECLVPATLQARRSWRHTCWAEINDRARLCPCRWSVHRSGWQRVLHGSRGSQEKLWARDRCVERWRHPAHPSLRLPPVLGRWLHPWTLQHCGPSSVTRADVLFLSPLQIPTRKLRSRYSGEELTYRGIHGPRSPRMQRILSRRCLIRILAHGWRQSKSLVSNLSSVLSLKNLNGKSRRHSIHGKAY